MDNSKNNGSFTSEEKGGNVFSLDLIAEAVKKGILANAGEQGLDKEQAFQENNYFNLSSNGTSRSFRASILLL